MKIKFSNAIKNGPIKYKRLFSISVSRDGFITIRYFTKLDGCPLKRKYGGILLPVVHWMLTIGFFSIVICVCEFEYAKT